MIPIKPVLTTEERNILILVAVHPSAQHLTNEEISQRLGIPVARVKTLLHEACQKLGAHNRNEATLLAMRRGEICLNELLSLDELAEILCSVDPEVIRQIANTIEQRQQHTTFPEQEQRTLQEKRRRSGILTNRERDVLIFVSRGLTNEEIADTLCMSASAVRTFLNRAFSKLGARKRADALQLALKKGELDIDDISSIEELTYYLAPLGKEAIEKLAHKVEEKQLRPLE